MNIEAEAFKLQNDKKNKRKKKHKSGPYDSFTMLQVFWSLTMVLSEKQSEM